MIKTIGLIGPGRLGRSIAAALPQDQYPLGPIASRHFVSARRAARELRRGRAVKSMAEAAGADYLFVLPPEGTTAQVLEELTKAADLKGKTVLYADPTVQVDSDLGVGAHACRFTPLRYFQHPIEDLTDIYFFLDGGSTAVRQARTLLRRCRARVVAAPKDSSVRVAAAAASTSDALTAVLEFAVELLVDSGLPHKRAVDALEPLVAGVLAEFARKRGKSRPRSVLPDDGTLVARHVDQLSDLDEKQGEAYRHILRLTRTLSERNCSHDPA